MMQSDPSRHEEPNSQVMIRSTDFCQEKNNLRYFDGFPKSTIGVTMRTFQEVCSMGPGNGYFSEENSLSGGTRLHLLYSGYMVFVSDIAGIKNHRD